MLAVDAATLATAISAAIAAIAACVAVLADLRRQRLARLPNVSAGFLSSRVLGEDRIEFVNMGPGLAISLAYLLVGNNLRQGGLIGTGHLQAGERRVVNVKIGISGKTVDFVWVCRDIDQRANLWSYAGQRRRLRKGNYPNLGECFRLMYPDVLLPPRTPGVPEDVTAPET